MLPEYFNYRPPYLESLGVRMLHKHGRYLDPSKLAVDIELMLELQGYQVIAVPHLPHHVEAFLAPDLQKVFVREYADDGHAGGNSNPRVRMSLAEEQAHIFLHLPALLGANVHDPGSVARGLRTVEYKRFEKDARYLAGALLMEATAFENRFKAHLSTGSARMWETRPTENVRRALRKVAYDFQVSITCATMRAYKLGLIAREVLDRVSS